MENKSTEEPTKEQIKRFKSLSPRTQSMIIGGHIDIDDIDMLNEAEGRAIGFSE